jgi:hypothetical protein
MVLAAMVFAFAALAGMVLVISELIVRGCALAYILTSKQI